MSKIRKNTQFMARYDLENLIYRTNDTIYEETRFMAAIFLAVLTENGRSPKSRLKKFQEDIWERGYTSSSQNQMEMEIRNSAPHSA